MRLHPVAFRNYGKRDGLKFAIKFTLNGLRKSIEVSQSKRFVVDATPVFK